jgi:hypothetical protein
MKRTDTGEVKIQAQVKMDILGGCLSTVQTLPIARLPVTKQVGGRGEMNILDGFAVPLLLVRRLDGIRTTAPSTVVILTTPHFGGDT